MALIAGGKVAAAGAAVDSATFASALLTAKEEGEVEAMSASTTTVGSDPVLALVVPPPDKVEEEVPLELAPGVPLWLVVERRLGRGPGLDVVEADGCSGGRGEGVSRPADGRAAGGRSRGGGCGDGDTGSRRGGRAGAEAVASRVPMAAAVTLWLFGEDDSGAAAGAVREEERRAAAEEVDGDEGVGALGRPSSSARTTALSALPSRGGSGCLCLCLCLCCCCCCSLCGLCLTLEVEAPSAACSELACVGLARNRPQCPG